LIEMKVDFAGLIKKLEIKSLVSGDKSARLVVDFQEIPEVIDKLNRLMRADRMVRVTVEKDEEWEEIKEE